VVYLELIFVIDVPYSHNDGTLGELQLSYAIIEFKHCETGFRIDAN